MIFLLLTHTFHFYRFEGLYIKSYLISAINTYSIEALVQFEIIP